MDDENEQIRFSPEQNHQSSISEAISEEMHDDENLSPGRYRKIKCLLVTLFYMMAWKILYHFTSPKKNFEQETI